MNYALIEELLKQIKSKSNPAIEKHLATGKIEYTFDEFDFAQMHFLDSEGKPHREGGPAVFYGWFGENYPDHEAWFLHGKPHRIDGPAVSDKNREDWFLEGIAHRIGGPAHTYVDYNGKTISQKWIHHGKPAQTGDYNWFYYGAKHWQDEEQRLHRTDGPAIIHENGRKEWFIEGKRHREDGPALIQANGKQKFYLHGKLYKTIEDFELNNAKPTNELTTITFKP